VAAGAAVEGGAVEEEAVEEDDATICSFLFTVSYINLYLWFIPSVKLCCNFLVMDVLSTSIFCLLDQIVIKYGTC